MMRGRVVVDLRNVFSPGAMREAGLLYSSIGRPSRTRHAAPSAGGEKPRLAVVA
jgi:hypothetical protein